MAELKLLTYKDLSQMLNIPMGSLYSMVSRKEIPFIRLTNRTIRFKEEEILKWIDSKHMKAYHPKDE